MIALFLSGLLTVAYGQTYSPRGWAPEGQAFNLPPRQLQPQYGAPNTQYLPSQQSARDFNRVENQYWQQNGQITQNLPQQNQWNQNTAQNTRFKTTNNKINIPQSNYDQLTQNSEPQPNYNRNVNAQQRPANQFQPKNGQLNPNESNRQFIAQPNRNSNENQYDFNLDSQSNNQFGRIVPSDQKKQTSDAPDNSPNIVQDKPQNFNQNKPPATQPPQYNGKAPEDLFRSKTDGKVNRAYGRTTTIKPEITTTEPETDDNENEGNESTNAALMAEKSMDIPTSGQYYLLLPDGRLQRVIYMTTADNANGYTANLMYENVEPLRGPIYSYNDSPLVRVN